MRKSTKLSTYHILFIIIAGCLSLLLFTLARITLAKIIGHTEIEISSYTFKQIMKNGLPFDLFIISFHSAIPVLVFFFSLWILKPNIQKALFKFTNWYYIISFPPLLILAIADIPYFMFFKNKITESAFQWMDNPKIVAEMLTGNSLHLILLGLSIVLCVFLMIFLRVMGKRILEKCRNYSLSSIPVRVLVILVLIPILFMGMRGRLDHPLREGDAFFSDNATVNQLALNPIFTLIKSYESKANLMDEKEALELTKKYLNINSTIDSISPIARFSEYERTGNKPNVILVLMESMSIAYTGQGGNTQGLTPNLDSLANISTIHTNMYSAGIHTNNGVFSTLYGYPALKRIRPMSTVPLRKYSGIPYVLKNEGYETYFFTTHDKGFDNMGAFLPFNSFDKIYHKNDYDEKAIIGPFGVPDDYVYSFAVNALSKKTEPFFATILSTSNHDPYIIPDDFPRKFNEKSLDAVHYADWSIGEFMKECSAQDWYENTVFLFIADHGINVGQTISGFALNYHHIPLIIFEPKVKEHKEINSFMQQVDVFPYLMSILKIPFINNTMGVSPTEFEREMSYSSSDDKLSAIDKEWLFVRYYSGTEYLYKLSEPESRNYIKDEPEIADKLRKYVFSQTQTADILFRNNKTQVE